MYTLYNKKLKKNLTHPAVGLWFTPNLAEAQDMLKACREYIAASHLPLADDIVIRVVETGELLGDEAVTQTVDVLPVP
jgi:hypothetical protein